MSVQSLDVLFPLLYIVLFFVYALQLVGLVLMLKQRDQAGACVAISGITLASIYVNLFYFWQIHIARTQELAGSVFLFLRPYPSTWMGQ